jgi:hypothetical protein
MNDEAGRWSLLTPGAWEGDAVVPTDAMPVEGARLLVTRPSGVSWLSAPVAGGRLDALEVDLDAPDKASFTFVAEDTGMPVRDVLATLHTEVGDDALFLAGGHHRSDREGLLSLALPARTKGRRQPSMRVEAEGGYLAWIAQIQPGAVQEIRIRRSAAVEGRAWLPSGEPAVGADVAWVSRGLVSRAVVGENGTYRLAGLAPWERKGVEGVARLLLLPPGPGAPVTSTNVRVRPGQTTRADIGAPAGTRGRARVVGRLRAGERPLAGQFVALLPEGKRDETQQVATTDADGRFTVPDVLPGRYRLLLGLGNLSAVDDFTLQAKGLNVDEDDPEPFDVVLPEGALVVRVVDGDTGKPIAGAVAAARPEQRSAGAKAVPGFQGTLGWSAFVDATGRARMDALLPEEQHEVFGYAEGYVESSVKGVLPGTGTSSPEVTVRLRRR